MSGPNKFTQVWLIYVPFWNDELLCTLNERNQNADKPQRDIPYSDAYDLICIWESVLETNYFEFNRKYCKQIIDCSMGAITSPEISDTKMYQFTNHFMSKLKFANQDLYHRRFRDDGFLAFNGTWKEFPEFFDFGNTCHEHFKFTFEMKVLIFWTPQKNKGLRFQKNKVLDINHM